MELRPAEAKEGGTLKSTCEKYTSILKDLLDKDIEEFNNILDKIEKEERNYRL